MSGRLKFYRSQLLLSAALLLLCVPCCFLLFWVAALPYAGDRLHENAAMILARALPFAGILLLFFCAAGALFQHSFALRHFILPLRRLRIAAAQIRDGNLDHVLSCAGNDEFTEVNRSFEEMRVRLKDSIRQTELGNRERSAMLAGICHDLKTPITSILGYSEGLLDGVAAGPEQTRDYLMVIRRKAEALRVLADDLSLLSQLENNQMTLHTQREDIGNFTRALAREFAAESPGFTLSEEVAEGLACQIDRAQFSRVLINILQNSVKYKKPADAAPAVRLRVTEADGKALLALTDNGVGVSAESLPYVYERFYRGDASRGAAAGSGLGLSIAWQIVHLHGGKTWLRSKEGEGTTVSILLPLCAPPQFGRPDSVSEG